MSLRSTPRPVGRALLGALVLVASVAVAACGDATESTTGIVVTGAWARTSPMDATNGAAYFTVTSEAADSLIGVKADASVAAKVELHETAMAMPTQSTMGMGADTTMGMGSGSTMPMGEMTMRPVAAIDLPAGTAVSLQPGGYHVMLFDLAAPLEVGDTITLTLVFTTADEVVVKVPVLDEAP